MKLHKKGWGYTKIHHHLIKNGFENIHSFSNHGTSAHMDRALAKTISGFSYFTENLKPDLIVVHGDRVEAMAGAIVGSLNNILVAHIEGGELSGTVDELIRHAVSKISHIHLVANKEARRRLVQLGELSKSIFILGSPDLDLMSSSLLPKLNDVKKYYEDWIVYSHGGTKNTGINAMSWLEKLQQLGAGEILLTSMDKDGTKDGFDLGLLKRANDILNIPVIASGGVGSLKHFEEGVTIGGASALLAASVFHFAEFSILDVKRYLQKQNIQVRF